jgi:hypothetical protein
MKKPNDQPKNFFEVVQKTRGVTQVQNNDAFSFDSKPIQKAESADPFAFDFDNKKP